jgi:hypothetical protein
LFIKLLSGNRATLRVVKDLPSEHPQSTIRTKCQIVSRQTAMSGKSYKRECQETFFPLGSVPTLFLSRHSAQPFERALVIEWSCSGDIVSCFVSSHETVRSFFLPVVPFHFCDGAIRF